MLTYSFLLVASKLALSLTTIVIDLVRDVSVNLQTFGLNRLFTSLHLLFYWQNEIHCCHSPASNYAYELSFIICQLG